MLSRVSFSQTPSRRAAGTGVAHLGGGTRFSEGNSWGDHSLPRGPQVMPVDAALHQATLSFHPLDIDKV